MDSLELQLLEDQQVDIGAFVDLQCLNVFSRGNQFYPSFYEAKSLAVLVRPTIAVLTMWFVCWPRIAWL